MTILLFECKKFFKNSKNIVIFAFMLVATVTICILQSQQLAKERETILQKDYFLHEKLLSDLEELENNSEMLTEEKDLFHNVISNLEDKVQYANSEKWKKSLHAEKKFITNIIRLQNKTSTEYLTDTQIEEANKNEYFLKNNIKPDNSLYGTSGMYFVRLLTFYLFSVFGYLFFLLLFFDIFKIESETNSINWLITLPISYKKIIKSKIKLSLLIVIITSILGLLIAFMTGFVLTRQVGILHYPVELFTRAKKIITLDFTNYLIIAFISFMLIAWVILILLSIPNKMNSEKILLIGVIALVFFSKIPNYANQYFLWVNFINLHSTILVLFQKNFMFCYMLILVTLFVSIKIILYVLEKH